MLSNLFTIGNDPQLKTIPSGKSVIGLSLACDVGWGDKKRTTWYSVALWEKRAESLAPYLVKGQQVFCVLDDIELDEYRKSDGTTGAKIKARIVDLKLVRGERTSNTAPQSYPKGRTGNTSPSPQPAQDAGFDSFDDDIPF